MIRHLAILAALLATGCAPTYRAIVRRTEGDRLSRCMRIWNGPECRFLTSFDAPEVTK